METLVRAFRGRQQLEDEEARRLAAAQVALRRAVAEEARLHAAVEEEARLRAAAEEEARLRAAAAAEEEVSAQHYRRLAAFAWMAVAAVAVVMLGMVVMALTKN